MIRMPFLPALHAAWPILAALPAPGAAPGRLRGLLAGTALLLAGLVLLPMHAAAQLNFKPLERGDVKEVDQKLVVVRGADGKEFALELGGDFAIRSSGEKAKRLDLLDRRTQFDEDFRLKIRTWFHQDVALHLTLQTAPSGFNDSNLRQAPADNRGSLTDSKPLTLTAREAYLLFNTNPNSHLLFGKQEISLGDRRGKVYDALQPGASFDCRVGTWCMPFGAIKAGEASADWIYHWALEYRPWDGLKNNMRDTLEVEIFRIIYTESNVPLGTNLGPATFDRENPEVATRTQQTDFTGKPIYFDAREQNYMGLRLNWLGGPLFANLDFTSDQGKRIYHRFREPNGGPSVGLPIYANGVGSKFQRESIAGYTYESELGFRWQQGQTGLRYMTATGDSVKPPDNGKNFLRVLRGYHEITPGTYRGSRIYFNGTDSDVQDGSGLGHSVNNTTLVGWFIDLDYPDDKKVGYSGGLFAIRKNEAIFNALGKLRSNVGLELDNVLTWHVHKAVKVQFEANVLRAGGAFSLDDFTPPDKDQYLFIQGIARLVYNF